MSSSKNPPPRASGSNSTPQKKKSSRTYTFSAPEYSGKQDELKVELEGEIGSQTWEFKPEMVAQMLSPKRQSPERQSQCLIDNPLIQEYLEGKKADIQPPAAWAGQGEPASYKPIAEFLNHLLDLCRLAYDDLAQKLPSVIVKERQWWPSLRFIVNDNVTKDGIRNAPRLKPDLIGTNDDVPHGKDVKLHAYWAKPDSVTDPNVLQIEIAVEVKGSWPDLVRQAATYGRAEIHAIPLREMSLVIGVNYIKRTLRFLLFHRGGVTSNKELYFDEPDDRLHMLKLMFCIMLWQSPKDAKLPSFTDGVVYRLPSKTISMRSEQKLYHSLSVRGRNTMVSRVRFFAFDDPHTPAVDTSAEKPSFVRRVTRGQVKKTAGRNAEEPEKTTIDGGKNPLRRDGGSSNARGGSTTKRKAEEQAGNIASGKKARSEPKSKGGAKAHPTDEGDLAQRCL